VWGYEFTTQAALLQGGAFDFFLRGHWPSISRARVLVHEVLDRGAQANVRGAARVLDRGVHSDARSGAQVLDRGAQAVARGAACCASQVLSRCARPLPGARLVVRCRYLIAVPRPLPAAALVMHRRAVFIYRDAKAVGRGGARCASKVLDRYARPISAAQRR
jgi:hypothetical protein